MTSTFFTTWYDNIFVFKSKDRYKFATTTPSAGVLWVGKIAFRQISPHAYRKRYKIGHGYYGSLKESYYVPDRTATVPNTSNDLETRDAILG